MYVYMYVFRWGFTDVRYFNDIHQVEAKSWRTGHGNLSICIFGPVKMFASAVSGVDLSFLKRAWLRLSKAELRS